MTDPLPPDAPAAPPPNADPIWHDLFLDEKFWDSPARNRADWLLAGAAVTAIWLLLGGVGYGAWMLFR